MGGGRLQMRIEFVTIPSMPSSLYPYCIFVMADGARADILFDLLSMGKLPHIQKIFAQSGTVAQATTAFPSTTGPAYIPFLAGAYPGPANMPGIRWFDRVKYSQKGFFSLDRFRSYVGAGGVMANKDISCGPTLFQLFQQPTSIFSIVHRGIGFRHHKKSLVQSSYLLFVQFAHRYRFSVPICRLFLNHAISRKSDFIFFSFPAIDEHAHFEGSFASQTIQTYIDLDTLIGEAADRLKKEKRFDQTLWVFTSDHGHADIERHFDPSDILEKNKLVTIEHFLKCFRKNAEAAVMVSGNAMAHLYIKHPLGWKNLSTIQELFERYPEIFQQLLHRPEIDLLIGKDIRGGILVKGKSGENHIVKNGQIITVTGTANDPLHIGQGVHHGQDREWLQKTVHSDYPDGPVQLLQLFESPRTGDIVLSASQGSDLRKRFEINPHRSGHGSLRRVHMVIPLLFSHPLPIHGPIRSIDVFSTICELCGIKTPPHQGISLLTPRQLSLV